MADEEYRLETKTFTRGEMLLEQGKTGNEAFLIKEGRVKVFLERNQRIIDLAELGPGQIIGEMSLVTGHENAASVEALEETNVGIISKQLIQDKIESSDPLVRELIHMLVERVRSTDSALLKSETREFIEIDLI